MKSIFLGISAIATIVVSKPFSPLESLSRHGGSSQPKTSPRGGGASQPNTAPKTWWSLDLLTTPGMTADLDILLKPLHSMVKLEDPIGFKLFESLFSLGTRRAEKYDNDAFNQMTQIVSGLSNSELLLVSRLMTHSLNLVNIAETNHRFRMIKAESIDHDLIHPILLNEKDMEMNHREDSVSGTIESIFKTTPDAKKEEIFDKLVAQSVELVLTAHPTEVNRRLLLLKHRQISEALTMLGRTDLTSFERSQQTKTIRSLIAGIWGSDEVQRSKPSVLKEARGGVAIIQSVLWDAVPKYLRELDSDCEEFLDRKLPLDCTPIRFASWMGGDRDGNPNVTPEVTIEVNLQQRRLAAKLYAEDLVVLHDDLAISNKYSPQLKAMADGITCNKHKIELYRKVIGQLLKRLDATVRFCDEQLAGNHNPDANDTTNDIKPITKREDLMGPIKIMWDSLVETGYEDVAGGLLTDIYRRLQVFGISLVPLDIREESTLHSAALDAITQYVGVGSYLEMSEDERVKFLTNELKSKRPLIQAANANGFANMGFDASVVKTLETFRAISTFESESLGAYVISQAKTASDVLAVMLLQKEFGMTKENGKMMRVVPLFETLEDLNNAPDTCSKLFSIQSYLAATDKKQEIMVGYSDSAKDAGRLAACWAQYESQEDMSKVAEKAGVQLTFFHGKGGTVSRGGNPSVYRAIVAHPPNTINGRFRVTEQGEMITQNFGSVNMAMRTLDIYTSSVLREAFVDHVQPSQKWRDEMKTLSEVSCTGYRALVRENPVFVPYFRHATPEQELQLLNVGSRPAKRNPKGGIESLRAIPWTFAWTQTRSHLSAWLGVGEALAENNDVVKEMYNKWPWFREMIDLVAMTLSKSDMSICENYDKLLVKHKDEVKLGKEIRNNLKLTREGVLRVTGYDDIDKGFKTLTSSMKYRAPYVDSLNAIQAELLKRWREKELKKGLMRKGEFEGGGELLNEESTELEDALVVSVNGIAQGLRNSG